MKPIIPQPILSVYQTLLQADYDSYFVGGCVRNMYLEKPIEDWDIATKATPQQTLELFPTAFYDNEFGTVGIPVEVASSNKKNVIEITTFRSEKGYQDKRHPTEISWGSSIEEDLLRRDFTFNAIAMKIIQNKSSYTTQIIYPFHVIEDLKKNLIKAVGDPNERFKEDALRLIRAIRFATTYSF